jgi:hypothetical protein
LEHDPERLYPYCTRTGRQFLGFLSGVVPAVVISNAQIGEPV